MLADMTELHKIVLRHLWRTPLTELALAECMSDAEQDEFYRALTPISLILAELREAELVTVDRRARLHVPPDVKDTMRAEARETEEEF